MNAKASILGLILVLAGAAGTWAYLTFWRTNNDLVLAGIVEVHEVRLGSKVGGRVLRVIAKEGDLVKSGDPLVEFEVPELENQKLQLLAQLMAAKAEYERTMNGARPEERAAADAAETAAKARWDRLVKGWRDEEKRAAASDFDAADADYKQANDEFLRVSNLVRQGSASRTDYEAALAARDRTRGRLGVARAKVDMLKAGNREEDVAEAKAEWLRAKAKADELNAGSRTEDKSLANAKVAEMEAKLADVEIRLREAIVRVPKDFGKAVVEVMAVRAGDLAPPNQPVVRVLKADDLWVKVFVPETKLPLVQLNQEVQVRIDSHGSKPFRGMVIKKATVAEFTPRNVQSIEERRYQMFGVKIRVDNADGVLNAGVAAEVTIPLAQP